MWMAVGKDNLFENGMSSFSSKETNGARLNWVGDVGRWGISLEIVLN